MSIGAKVDGLQYRPFERVKIDLQFAPFVFTPYARFMIGADNNELLRRIAFDSDVSLLLKSLNLAGAPLAFEVPSTPAIQIIAPAQFMRGYQLFNADNVVNSSSNAIFLGLSPDVTVLNGYPLPIDQEKPLFLRENVSLWAIGNGGDDTVPLRILQMQ